jgi:hypothetical protein
MKIINKTTALLFLLLGLLTSCNSSTSQPGIRAADVMETSMAMVKTEIVETLTAASTSTPSFSPAIPTPIPPTQTPSYDRHDPEAVVRAWFDAWERTDGNMMDLLNGTNTYGNYGFEPTDSITILEIQLLESPSEAQRIYRVWFDVQYTDPNKGSGKTQLKFYLTWDVNRDAWIITNHGYT